MAACAAHQLSFHYLRSLRKIRAIGFAQLANGRFALLFAAGLIAMTCCFRHGCILFFAAETQPIADCSGHNKRPRRWEARAKSSKEETCCPSPKTGASTTEMLQFIYGLFA
jgi:hypothetical protein